MKKKSKQERLLALYVKQLNSSTKILEHLFKIYKSGLDKGYDVVGVSYLIDLLVLRLMPLYGGDTSIIEGIKKNLQNEMIAFNASPPIKDTIEELKKSGIDFSVLYDVRKKEVVPTIDVKKLKLSDTNMKDWVGQNLNRVKQLVETIEQERRSNGSNI